MSGDNDLVHEPLCIYDMAKMYFPYARTEREEIRGKETEETTQEGDF